MIGLVVLLTIIVWGFGFIIGADIAGVLSLHVWYLAGALAPIPALPRARRKLRHRRCLRRIADLEAENEIGPPWWCLEPGTTDYGHRTYYMPYAERQFRRASR